jgi:large subunit ribosomal protein L19
VNNNLNKEPPIPEKPKHVLHLLPEFLPNPSIDIRHKIREKLERKDMLKRRTQIDIPEFYVGSVMAVTVSDPHAPGKTSRFLGICTERGDTGLKANFTLRNVIDNQGQ